MINLTNKSIELLFPTKELKLAGELPLLTFIEEVQKDPKYGNCLYLSYSQTDEVVEMSLSSHLIINGNEVCVHPDNLLYKQIFDYVQDLLDYYLTNQEDTSQGHLEVALNISGEFAEVAAFSIKTFQEVTLIGFNA